MVCQREASERRSFRFDEETRSIRRRKSREERESRTGNAEPAGGGSRTAGPSASVSIEITRSRTGIAQRRRDKNWSCVRVETTATCTTRKTNCGRVTPGALGARARDPG